MFASAIAQLAVQKILWDSLVAHSRDMTKPAKPALTEGKIHSGEYSTSLNFFVGDLLLSSNFKNTTKAS